MTNRTIKLYVLAWTGDCPAISLLLNFVNHNGHYSCWFCFIDSHYMNHKRQFHHQPVVLRTSDDYWRLAKKREKSNKHVFGHFGRSITTELLDTPLPNGIVPDYLHVTVLGQSEKHRSLNLSTFTFTTTQRIQRETRPSEISTYVSLTSPSVIHATSCMNWWPLPFCLDFFNREIRSMENSAFIKGTEVRNLLFFGLLQNLDEMLSVDHYAHLAMYICATRLLHSGNLMRDGNSSIKRINNDEVLSLNDGRAGNWSRQVCRTNRLNDEMIVFILFFRDERQMPRTMKQDNTRKHW